MLRPWLNDGLLLSTGKCVGIKINCEPVVNVNCNKYIILGSKWQNRRKLLTNTFHFKTLNMYNPSLNNHSRTLVKKLLEVSADNKEICITEYMTLCSLDMMCGNLCIFLIDNLTIK